MSKFQFTIISHELKLNARCTQVLNCILRRFPDMYPGINYLCRDAQLSRNTVIKAIKQLEFMAIITVIRQGRGKVNRYFISERFLTDPLIRDQRKIQSTVPLVKKGRGKGRPSKIVVQKVNHYSNKIVVQKVNHYPEIVVQNLHPNYIEKSKLDKTSEMPAAVSRNEDQEKKPMDEETRRALASLGLLST